MEVLADDEQAGFRQQMVDVRHAAGEAVLARQHGKLRAALAHRVHRGLERLARQRGHVRIGDAAGEVGIGAGHTLEGDRPGHAGPPGASTRRARSRSSGVSTPNGPWSMRAQAMRMPASSARNCSSFSRRSSGDGGSAT